MNPVLQPGTAYWLVAAPSHSGTHAAWNLNAIGASGLHAASINGNPFNVSSNAPGAFRILGTPFAGGPHIPEPSSLALLGFGAAAVWLRRQRRG